MQNPHINTAYIVVIISFLCITSNAQELKSIHWLSFEQLEDSLNIQKGHNRPKKVFIDFYTNWCTYCRKMDKVVFTKPEVIELINERYHAVRFDAETRDTVTFGGQTFINDQIGKKRAPIHQIARLLASRKGQFIPPTLLVLDSAFNVTARYFEYMDSKKLMDEIK